MHCEFLGIKRKVLIMKKFHSFLIAVTTILSLVAGAMVLSPAMAADEPTVLITGSSRGIGLELARVYAERGWNVIATCRTPSKADDLQAIAAQYDNVAIEELDVTDDEEIASLAAKYNGKPIDVLLNNAGIPGDRTRQVFGTFDQDVFDQVMHVNVMGPLKTAVAFMDNVAASDQKKIINISSSQGSLASTNRTRGNSYFYKSSKSSLNMVTRIMALEMKDQGIIVGLVSPGWVHTDFGGGDFQRGMITPVESATSVAAVIDDYDMDKAGLLFSYTGEQTPW
jgi:NAD(P)-dependent dehydrogenase (short-subunit alcohol dehydrogenase family)